MESFKSKIRERFYPELYNQFNRVVKQKVMDDWMNENSVDEERILEFHSKTLCNLYHISWNPYDVTEDGESLEEKIKIYTEHTKEEFDDVITNYPYEILGYVAAKHLDEVLSPSKVFVLTPGTNNIEDPYTFQFQPKYSEILIEWLGVKRMFKY